MKLKQVHLRDQSPAITVRPRNTADSHAAATTLANRPNGDREHRSFSRTSCQPDGSEAVIDMASTASNSSCGMDTMVGARESDATPHAYSLFQQPWWLDAVAPGAWDEVRVERDGKTLARLPFMVKRKFGLTALTQPPLTYFLGPWLSPSQDPKYTTQLTQQKELMQQLIALLPPYDVCRFQFAPEVTNWLPFYWAGFTATPYYTYRIWDVADEDALWAEMHTLTRTQIRKASSTVMVRTDLGIDAMFELQERTYARHGWIVPDRDLIYRIHDACTARCCCQLFVSEDAKGHRHSCTYIVWDSHCAYAVSGGMNHDLARSGAPVLVKWEVLKYARRVTKSFDFVGSMFEPAEQVFRKLGARQVTYLSVSRLSRRMRVLSAARELAAAVAGLPWHP
jgi:Acetyltransferase (GNAT) domain